MKKLKITFWEVVIKINPAFGTRAISSPKRCEKIYYGDSNYMITEV